MKTFVLVCLVLLMPFVVFAQEVSWQSMDGPYYISDVTGISIGYQGGQTYAYAIGSDLEHEYIYYYQGNSPISHWSRSEPDIDGLKFVSASRNVGNHGYAVVPSGPVGFPGVYFTVYGTSWARTSSQPGNLQFTSIETHPGNGNICFTSSSHADGLSSVYKTTNGGQDWSSAGAPSTNNCNSVKVDLNSGSLISTTTAYACFEVNGIYKSTNGGTNWTQLSLPGYGTSYSGIDIAAIGNDLYAISRVFDDPDYRYELWHSSNGGTSWVGNAPVLNCYDDPVYKIMFFQVGGQDAAWAVSENYIYFYDIGQSQMWWIWDPDFTPTNCAALDEAGWNPGGELYTGSEIAIIQNYYTEDYAAQRLINKGLNISDVAAIDCIEGYNLRALSKEGGIQSVDPLIVYDNLEEEWQPTVSFLDIASDNVTGKIMACYTQGDYEKSIAYASDDGTPYMINDGVPVTLDGVNPPSQINAIGGSCFNNSWSKLEGGKSTSGQNVIWGTNTQYQSTDLLIGFQAPEVKGLLHDRFGGGEYYFCGTRSNTGENIAGYRRYAPLDVVWLNEGLDDYDVLHANSILKSKEIVNAEYEPMLYIGTEKGVFKTSFNRNQPGNWGSWYPASNGIPVGVEIVDLTNYYHILQNSDLTPDPLVQYALGKDGSNNPYLYISADSGRSWIEFGSYFRERNIQGNDMATFSDRRDEFISLLNLGVATDNGVYRFPYNVKSGVIAEDETWGPGLVIVNGDITIQSTATLAITAPCTLMFVYNYDRLQGGSYANQSELIVNGKLKAWGNSSQPIVFMSSDPVAREKSDWYGIRVNEDGIDSLNYCIIKNARYGIYADKPGALVVEHCLIDSNYTAGIYTVSPPTSTRIRYSKIQNSGNFGIYARCDSITISADTVINTQTGISIQTNYGPVIAGCLISYNLTPNTSSDGITVSRTSIDHRVIVDGDSIYGFHQNGIYLSGAGSNSKIKNSRVVSCGARGIYCKSSSPTIGDTTNLEKYILCRNCPIGMELYIASSPTIRGTKFFNNTSRGLLINSTCFPNFGTPTDRGINSFMNSNPAPTYYDAYNANLAIIQGANNYWGENPPTAAQIFNVSYNPYLTRDYLPQPRRDAGSTVQLPEGVILAKAYPNPFNPSTNISFELPSVKYVTVKIYNVLGQEVTKLFDGMAKAGENNLFWNARNASGDMVANGMYLCRIETQDSQATVKLTVLK
jgi:hypothetical protein